MGRGKGRKSRDGNPPPDERTLEPIRTWEVEEPLDMQAVMSSFKSIGETNGELRNLRETRKNLNTTINEKQGHLNELLKETETMRRKTKVKVKEVPDYDNKRVAIVREDMDADDPKATVSYRPMTGGELQATPARTQQTLAEVARRGAEVFNFDGSEPAPTIAPDPGLVEGLKQAIQ